MRRVTRTRCEGLSSVRVRARIPARTTYDGAVSLLVAHTLTYEEQPGYWLSLARSVRPGGFAIVSWLDAVSPRELEAWCAFAARTLSPRRVALLRARLTTPGPLFLASPDRQLAHARAAGFRRLQEPFRALGVRLLRFTRE